MVSALSSSRDATASAKETPCFREFSLALPGSHSVTMSVRLYTLREEVAALPALVNQELSLQRDQANAQPPAQHVSNPTDFFRAARVSMLDLNLGDDLLFETPVAFLLQTDLWEMVQHSGPALMAVLGVLIC